MQEKFMQRAIELAKKGVGFTSPNPVVGAVVVKGGKIIGEGWHKKAGSKHAEVIAIDEARKKGSVRGTTVYVTLEPCCHYGKTPPCTNFLISSGIKKVVIGMVDSFWRVNRQGILQFKRHGIDVELAQKKTELYADILRLNQPFLKWAGTGLPYVTLKAAVTLDGKIATRTGESKWITSKSARDDARIERSMADAVLVGAGTVALDDPELAAHGAFAKKSLLRVIIDPTLSLDTKRKVFRDEHVFVACAGEANAKNKNRFERAGIQFRSFGGKSVSLKRLFQYLGKQSITNVFVEGGSGVHGFLYDEARKDPMVLDRVLFYIAPKIIGGKDSLPAVGGQGVRKLEECLKLINVETSDFGGDIKVQGIVNEY